MPALLRERGFGLRPATAADMPFLAALYASNRATELASVPWPESARRAFLDSQFALQHRHYVQHYPEADFLVITRAGQPQGRLYLHRGIEEDLVIDISLLPACCGLGVGSALLAGVVQRAQKAALGVQLHVLHTNTAARRLYERLGFQVVGDTGSHLHMRHRAGATADSVS